MNISKFLERYDFNTYYSPEINEDNIEDIFSYIDN